MLFKFDILGKDLESIEKCVKDWLPENFGEIIMHETTYIELSDYPMPYDEYIDMFMLMQHHYEKLKGDAIPSGWLCDNVCLIYGANWKFGAAQLIDENTLEDRIEIVLETSDESDALLFKLAVL